MPPRSGSIGSRIAVAKARAGGVYQAAAVPVSEGSRNRGNIAPARSASSARGGNR